MRYSKSACLIATFSSWKQVNSNIFEICLNFVTCKQHIYTSLSVSVASRRITHKNRFTTFVRSCSVVRASKGLLEISYSKSACLITPFSNWKLVNAIIFEICLLFGTYKQQIDIHMFTIETSANIIFRISTLVYLQ